MQDAALAVLERLEHEDAQERVTGVARELRGRQIAPGTGRFLFSLVAHRPGCRVLEVGGSRGYSALWLASGARVADGRVVSIEHDPQKARAWRANIREARLDDIAELLEGDAFALLGDGERSEFEFAFIDAEKEDYDSLFPLVRKRLTAGSLVVADNVLSHVETLGAYSAARQADPTLISVTVPLDRGLELSTVL